MIKRKLTEADWFLIAANLLPVYGVCFEGWNAKEVFLVYCLETIIIGFFTLVKLGMATAVRKKDWWENDETRVKVSGVFFMLFFLFHYGLFVGIQTGLFLGVLSMQNGPSIGIADFIFHPGRFLGKEGWLMLCVFVFAYGYENLMGFIWNNEYRTKSFGRIMFEPYIRIFVQQFTVIIGTFVLIFGADKIFILVFASVRIFFTVFINYSDILDKARRKEVFLRKE